MTRLMTSLVILGLLLRPAPASAQHVYADYDTAADFTSLKSYAWRAGQPAPSPLVDARILSAIDAQLASKGWTKVDAAPSAIVVYRAGVDVQRQLNGWSSGPRWTGMGTVNVQQIRTGQLTVDIYDASTERLVWRGLASDVIGDKPDKNEKRLNDAVAKLFKQFPPARAAHAGTQ